MHILTLKKKEAMNLKREFKKEKGRVYEGELL